MQNELMVKASEAIAALWLKQLHIISESTGVEMAVLYNCLNMQVPDMPKKRAPAKKKEPAVAAVATDGEEVTEKVTEKVTRAPAK